MKPLKKIADYFLVVLATGAYGGALVLPTWLCAGDPLVGAWVLGMGWLGLLMFDPRWFCNMLPVLAIASLFTGKRIVPWWASMLIAVVAATTLFGPYLCAGGSGALGVGTGPASGQLLWVSSMFLFALWDPSGLQKTRSAARGAPPGVINPPSLDPRSSENSEDGKQNDERVQRDVDDYSANRGRAAMGTSEPHIWPLDALVPLDSKRLESLCVSYYGLKGFVVKSVSLASDDGVVAALYKTGFDRPVAVVQCRIRGHAVKAEQVRAMGRLLQEQEISRGVIWSVSGYLEPSAKKLAEEAGIQLLDGVAIVKRLRMLDRDKQTRLWASVKK